MAVRALAIAAALALSGCAGVPIGHHTHLFIGIGLVRVDRAGPATAISSRSFGVSAGCQLVLIGAQESFCAHIPIDGDVAIIERGQGPDQHLTLVPLRHKEKTP